MKKSTRLVVVLIIAAAIIGLLESCTSSMSPHKAASRGGMKCGKGYIR